MEAQHMSTEIARLLGRHRSAISHEIERGSGMRGKCAEQLAVKPKSEAETIVTPDLCSHGCRPRWATSPISPKKRCLKTVMDEDLTKIKNKLNNCHRKRRGFMTLHEVLHASLNSVALHP